MDKELIQYLVKEANRLGRMGNRVIGWVPPTDATHDYRGAFVIEHGRTLDGATDQTQT